MPGRLRVIAFQFGGTAVIQGIVQPSAVVPGEYSPDRAAGGRQSAS